MLTLILTQEIVVECGQNHQSAKHRKENAVNETLK